MHGNELRLGLVAGTIPRNAIAPCIVKFAMYDPAPLRTKFLSQPSRWL